MNALLATRELQQRLRIRGVVQGVGFRPFVYRLAKELALDGWVRNDGEGVEIALRGAAADIARFHERLTNEAPRLARIDAVAAIDAANDPIEAGFRIETSRRGAVTTGVTPDAATCEDCVADIFDPSNRRWRYAFTNCTHCGPRFTITARLPYDRPNTSMARFAMCPACRREYDDPLDRRFHAQPNACPVCGPRLALADSRGAPLDCDDVIREAVARIARGEIVAIKGLGGFHLVCDARNAAAVAELRARKNRDEKPFALMFANCASIEPFARVGDAARALLESRERPIVLLDKRAGADEALPGVAPGLASLGCMLPCTPIQFLLFHEAAGRPSGTAWLGEPQPLALVMTSANPGGEPLVIDNREAVARLGGPRQGHSGAGIADAFVMHDRDILVRCDDSVVRVEKIPPAPLYESGEHSEPARFVPPFGKGGLGGISRAHPRHATRTFTFIRRARGYTPAPIKLPRTGPSVLATGSSLKNAACLTRGAEAFLSQHIGDLDNAASCVALEEAVDHLQRVLEIKPEAIAHDLHPDFFSSRLAAQLAAELAVPAIGVQHHHAHIAAVAAEHRVEEPVLGVALDGVGHGSDGDAWGGELLRVDAHGFERLGHLRALPLAGGDRAAREPWRMAAAVLHLAGRGDEIVRRYAHQPAAAAVADMLARAVRCPPTTSAGRWFDAAAGLLGVRDAMNYEAQAAMLLEGLAAKHGTVAPDANLYALDADNTLDLLPLALRLADERDAAFGAALFHATLAAALAAWAARAARTTGITTVALGGGCFLNAILSTQLERLLAARGYRVLHARQAPPNDGGIALGQAWVALQGMTGV
jgi:hydrogenase maturation protein HypF